MVTYTFNKHVFSLHQWSQCQNGRHQQPELQVSSKLKCSFENIRVKVHIRVSVSIVMM